MATINEKIRLARAFGDKVQELSRHDFRQAVDRNKAEEWDSDICHSHDFCDANMLMLEAFVSVVGRNPDFLEDASKSEDIELWGDAWAIAKAADFFA